MAFGTCFQIFLTASTTPIRACSPVASQKSSRSLRNSLPGSNILKKEEVPRWLLLCLLSRSPEPRDCDAPFCAHGKCRCSSSRSRHCAETNSEMLRRYEHLHVTSSPARCHEPQAGGCLAPRGHLGGVGGPRATQRLAQLLSQPARHAGLHVTFKSYYHINDAVPPQDHMGCLT